LGPCGFRRLFCQGDEAAYWALPRLKNPNGMGRGSLDSRLTVEWSGATSRPNTNRKNPGRQLDVMSAAWNEVKAFAHRGDEDKQQGNQPNGRLTSIGRH